MVLFYFFLSQWFWFWFLKIRTAWMILTRWLMLRLFSSCVNHLCICLLWLFNFFWLSPTYNIWSELCILISNVYLISIPISLINDHHSITNNYFNLSAVRVSVSLPTIFFVYFSSKNNYNLFASTLILLYSYIINKYTIHDEIITSNLSVLKSAVEGISILDLPIEN
jgi:hypothetical protein